MDVINNVVNKTMNIFPAALLYFGFQRFGT